MGIPVLPGVFPTEVCPESRVHVLRGRGVRTPVRHVGYNLLGDRPQDLSFLPAPSHRFRTTDTLLPVSPSRLVLPGLSSLRGPGSYEDPRDQGVSLERDGSERGDRSGERFRSRWF